MIMLSEPQWPPAYYTHRPARLERWHPGPGVILGEAPEAPGYRRVEDGMVLGSTNRVRRTAAFVRDHGSEHGDGSCKLATPHTQPSDLRKLAATSIPLPQSHGGMKTER